MCQSATCHHQYHQHCQTNHVDFVENIGDYCQSAAASTPSASFPPPQINAIIKTTSTDNKTYQTTATTEKATPLSHKLLSHPSKPAMELDFTHWPASCCHPFGPSISLGRGRSAPARPRSEGPGRRGTSFITREL